MPKAKVHLLGHDIAVLLTDSEQLFPSMLATGASHQLLHLPEGCFDRGSALAWAMYGLERYGDYLCHLSESRHTNRHVSLAKQAQWMEFICFLRVHDPEKYADLGVDPVNAQPHMFSTTAFRTPSSWMVKGARSRVCYLQYPDNTDQIVDLYKRFSIELNLVDSLKTLARYEESMLRSVVQICGKLWIGSRFLKSLPEGLDPKSLSKGECLMCWPSNGEPEAYAGDCYGIIRDILLHEPFAGAPAVYLMRMAVLDVNQSNDFVPLLRASPSETEVWICQSQVSSSHWSLCVPDDVRPDDYYLLELN